MRRLAAPVAAVAAVFVCASVFAQSPFPDPHGAPLSAPPVKYQKMHLIDFKTDKASLIGKRVELTGIVAPFHDDLGLLTAGVDDVHPVYVDVAQASRDQRRRFHTCPSRCSAWIFGTVATVSVGQIGIRADAISMTNPSQLIDVPN